MDVLASLIADSSQVGASPLAGIDPPVLVAAAEHEQIVMQALRALEQVAARPDGGVVRAHVDAMRGAARRWTLYEELQRKAVHGLFDDLPGVRVLAFKGAALAYGMYTAPADRMRMDWDLLVEPARAATVERVLLARGFTKDLKTPPGIRMRQQAYRLPIGDGECTIDLHTGVFNAPALASRIGFDSLYAQSVPLPSLHREARGTGAVDSLILACLHRLVHHAGETRLVWDVDIRLLVRALAERMDDVAARAREWKVGPLVASEIRRAAGPVAGIDALAAQDSDVGGFAAGARSRADDFLLDWRALGWRDRAALARETFLPDAAFVKSTAGSRLPAPLLYARRLLRGAAAWLRRPRPPAPPRAGR